MSRVRAATVILAFATAGLRPPLATADDAALAKSVAKTFAAVQTHTLPNGLRVYLLPIPGAPTVTTMVAYKVGSCDEEKSQTGLSHYLEHLLFKGTERLMPGDIDRATQRNGGRNNAYTNNDMTCYHFDFAADRWTIGLEIEADRMRNVRIDEKHEFQQEKGAVVAELKGNEDQPWDLEYKAAMAMLYPSLSPYSHPVIGEEKHVRAATAEIIKRYYDQWYHPNNASLVVVGGFDPAAATEKIAALFGPIPKGEQPPRKAFPAVPARAGPVRHELPSKFDVPRMLMGFNGVPSGDADEYALDVAEEILSSGKTCRLYRRLVEGDRSASNIGASNTAGRYPGWFGVNVEALPGKDRAKIEAAVFAELKKLATEPISAAELNRVRRGLIAQFVYASDDVHGLADVISKAVTTTGLDDLRGYLDKVLAVTPADVQRVAAKYLAKESAIVVWSVPPAEKKSARPVKFDSRNGIARHRADAPAGAAALAMTDAKRVVLPNGLKLILLENHRLPVVVAAASVADVRLREPADKAGVYALVGDALDEGTAAHTSEQIAALIEDAGGRLNMSAGGGSVRVLAPDFDLGLGLLIECLTAPSFPAEKLAAKREQLLAAIADDETQPQARAAQAFQSLVYGDHPYGRPGNGRKEIVAKLTPEDCRQFHAAAFGPDATTLVIVGDFDAAAAAKKVEALTATWKKLGTKPPVPAAPPVVAKPVEKIISDPQASQTHVFIGHLGVRRTDPDYYALVVMDNVLGTGPGFTDRLSATLRDRQGLAYTVRAMISSSASDQPGAFTGYIGTFPDKFVWVRDGFLKEVNRIRDEPPTAQEVDDAKKYLLGSLPFRLASSAAVAGELLDAEKYNLGFDALAKYRAAVAAVTPTDVQRVAKKHLDPTKLAVVAVGPIDAAGKPLPPGKDK